MRRQISSPLTLFYKFSPIIFTVIALAVFTFVEIVSVNSVVRHPLFIGYFILLIALGIYGYVKPMYPWRIVNVDDSNMYVSEPLLFGGAKEIVVPFANITQVRQAIWGMTNWIEIKYFTHNETVERIMFHGKFRYAAWKKHPIIKELNHLVRDAKSLSQ